MKICILLNRNSGSAIRWYDVMGQLARQHGVPIETAGSDAEFREAARRAARRGCERIVVAGGDGTVSSALCALAPDLLHVELGILPLGTGNDFARSLGIPLDNCETAFRCAVEGVSAALDVGQVRSAPANAAGAESRPETAYFINVANGGLAGLVAHDLEAEDKARWGPFAYWMKTISELVHIQEYRVTLELDEQTADATMYGLVIANGRYVGGGFPLAPEARLDDGLFDVIAIGVLPTLDLLAAGLDFWRGRNPLAEQIQTYRSRRVHVQAVPAIPFSIDGEATQTLDASFEVLPQAAHFVIGEQPPCVTMTR